MRLLLGKEVQQSKMFLFMKTRRLFLRRLEPDDVEAMYAYRANPDVSRYQSWEPQTHEEVRSFIERVSATTLDRSAGWHQVGIQEQRSGRLIGDCGVHILDAEARQVEFGITISPQFQRQGFATETLQATFHHLYVKLGVHRITASVDPRNHPSLGLMQSLGMRMEGHFIQSVWLKGGWVDDVIFAMLESEWRANRAEF